MCKTDRDRKYSQFLRWIIDLFDIIGESKMVQGLHGGVWGRVDKLPLPLSWHE